MIKNDYDCQASPFVCLFVCLFGWLVVVVVVFVCLFFFVLFCFVVVVVVVFLGGGGGGFAYIPFVYGRVRSRYERVAVLCKCFPKLWFYQSEKQTNNSISI